MCLSWMPSWSIWSKTQPKINDLALAANEKRYEAYCLEQDALKMLNEQIIFAK